MSKFQTLVSSDLLSFPSPPHLLLLGSGGGSDVSSASLLALHLLENEKVRTNICSLSVLNAFSPLFAQKGKCKVLSEKSRKQTILKYTGQRYEEEKGGECKEKEPNSDYLGIEKVEESEGDKSLLPVFRYPSLFVRISEKVEEILRFGILVPSDIEDETGNLLRKTIDFQKLFKGSKKDRKVYLIVVDTGGDILGMGDREEEVALLYGGKDTRDRDSLDMVKEMRKEVDSPSLPESVNGNFEVVGFRVVVVGPGSDGETSGRVLEEIRTKLKEEEAGEGPLGARCFVESDLSELAPLMEVEESWREPRRGKTLFHIKQAISLVNTEKHSKDSKNAEVEVERCGHSQGFWPAELMSKMWIFGLDRDPRIGEDF